VRRWKLPPRGKGGWRAGRTALLGLIPSLLVGQSLPGLPIPSAQESSSLYDLLPYRPYELPEREDKAEPLSYRGENISGGAEEGWIIERGAIEGAGMLLLADHIEFHPKTGQVKAEGHIRLEATDLRLLCERLEMDIQKQIGQAWALQLELPPYWTLKSQKVQFTTLRHWEFEHVDLSPCPQEKPGWSASLSSLKLDLEQFATFRNARVFLGPVPILYLPWAAYPAKTERSSGLLSLMPGYSSTLGTTLDLSYYQVIGDTMDATFHPKLFSREGVLWGGEYRWAPEPTHEGSFQGEYIHQKSDGRDRYRYSLKELWQREDGWQFMTDMNMASDSLLDSDYGSGQLGTNSFDSSVYLGKNFSLANVNISASEQRSFFLPQDTSFYDASFPSSLRKRSLPQLQARFYPISLGDFYLDGGFRLGRLSYQLDQKTANTTYEWLRDDFLLHMQGRLAQWGPIRADLQLASRFTYYGASLHSPVFEPRTGSGVIGDSTATNDSFRVDGDALRRALGSAKIQFSGSQIGRTFEHFSLLGYTGELKHVIEPFVGLVGNSLHHNEGYIPRFDDVDSRPGVDGTLMGERSIEFGLKQHLLGRPGAGTSFTDLVRWRISVKYFTQPVLLTDGRYKQGWGSIDNDIDVEPNDRLRVSFRRSSDVGAGSSVADSSLSFDYKARDGSLLSLAAFSTGLNTFLVRQQGISLGGIQHLWDDRFRLEFKANYDYRAHQFLSAQAALAYMTPCVASSLRFTHVSNQIPGTRKEDRLDFVITLRGLGDVFPIEF